MPAFESTNTFSGGMHSDASKFFQSPDTYLEALNFRIVTENGQSNHALVNIKGNEYKTTLNNTYPVYKIVPNVTIVGSTVPSSVQINGTTSPIVNVTTGTTGFEIYTVISQMANFNIDFYAAYYQDAVVIWSQTIDPNPTLTSAGLAFETQYGLVKQYVAAQSNLIPIGSTYIRDDIYVFTTPTSSAPSGTGTVNSGQIWRLEYDRILLTATLTLVYNNYVDFDIDHPIPPTATQGRYENDDIQRLYWTDDYNPLRSCNAKDPNLMAFPVGLLSIFPLVQPFIPTLQSFQQTGSLKTGVYQFAYRLRKSNSQLTLWSPLSLPIPIYNNIQEANYTGGGGPGGWQAYIGLPAGVTNTSKSITATIKKLDQNYDFVDIVVCKRFSYNDPGTFEIFKNLEPIDPNQPLTFTYTGSETVTTLTLQEFLLTSPGFTHCKSIETKDNRLFAGNVRVAKADLNYDARAYQFTSSSPGPSICNLTHNNITTPYTYTGQLDQPFFLPETHDAINSDYLKVDPNNSNAALRPTNAQRFYPGTTQPGGAGPNISFKFGAYAVKIDDVPNTDFGATPDLTPWRHTNEIYNTYNTVDLNLGIDKEDYPFHSINDSYKTAYKSFLLRSYQPNEIYRFGIQFYDKQGSPYYTKWIADIRMPDYTDSSVNVPLGDSNAALTQDFMLCQGINSGNGIKYYMKPMYLNFTVDVTSIKDQISGFEIVRVERTDDDKTVSATGYMTQVEYENNTSSQLVLPNSQTVIPNNSNLFLTTTGAAAAGRYRDISYTLDSWDWQYGGNPGIDLSNDRVVVKGAAVKTIGTNIGYVPAATTYDDGYWYAKNYSFAGNNQAPTNITADELKMTQLDRVPQGATATSVGGVFTYHNRNIPAPATTGLRTLGNVTYYTEFSAAFTYGQYYGAFGAPYKIYFEYRKYGKLANQYGGRTYSDRTQSIYISCGMFVPIDDANLVNSGTDRITFGVFGGDMFHNVVDNQKGDKYNPNRGTGGIESFIHYNPQISYHNADLRCGAHFESNYGGQVNSGTWTAYVTSAGSSAATENYNYDNTYSLENNVRKFFPKPLLINTTDNWDNRVYYSEVKINGEVQDSWENFKTNNYWDVEGSYGPINSLIAYADRLYFIQKKAFGWLLVNMQSLVSNTAGVALSVGKGDVIGRHEYVSTDVGTAHQWSVSRSPQSILFVDATNKKVYKYSKNGLVPISDVYEQKGTFVRLLHDDILVNDNPITNSGILCAYDFYNDEYLITLLNKYSRRGDENTVTTQEYNTISFNEKADRWNSFYSFTPNLYIFNRTQLWSNNPLINRDLYIHNEGPYSEFYGTIYPSTVKLLSNHNSRYTKLFNNFMFNTEAIAEGTTNSIYDDVNVFDSTFNSFRAYNDYQNTDFVTLTPTGANKTIKRIERQWNLQCPRNKVLYTTASPNIFTNLGTKLYGERMRDKYLTIDLSYNNNNGYKFIFNNFNTKYLVSDR